MTARRIPRLAADITLRDPDRTVEAREGRWSAERHFPPEQWPVYTQTTRGYTVRVVYVLEDSAEELRKKPVDLGPDPTGEEKARWERYVNSLEGQVTLTIVTVIKMSRRRGGSR